MAAWEQEPGSHGTERALLAEFSASAGQRLRVLDGLGPGGVTLFGGTVWSADPSGQHVLIGGDLNTTGAMPAPGPGFARVEDNGRRIDWISPLPGQASSLAIQSGAW